ncbi:MAG TPA: DUF167 domain-containing protein [Candidatus Andersenbacteria bacterium]|nr:DUF167 domain-containing protein [Candidatus Andersenbacteria bacterium]
MSIGMKITVKVTANARQEAVEEIREGYYKVRVTAKPVGGKANEAVIKLLAEYFDVPPSRVRIVFGKTSREKMVEIAAQ